MKYNLERSIGKGNYAEVFLGVHVSKNINVAIKIVDKAKIKRLRLKHQLKREVDILSLVNHPHIISLIDYFKDSNNYYIVTTYMENGDLFEKVHQTDSSGNSIYISRKTIKTYIYQLALAVSYLHKNNIIHRDIKLENILLDSNNNIILTDFGWSVRITDKLNEEHQNSFCGTLDYLSPEVVMGLSYSYPVDIWCIGILTYELLNGSPPFSSDTVGETYEKIKNVDIKFDGIPDSARDFINNLLAKNPYDRLTADKIPTHPWII